MRDLGERHATPVHELLDETWRIMAHDDLRRRRRVAGKPDRWLANRVIELKRRYDGDARRLITAEPTITARALADRLRFGSPPPSRSSQPTFDRQAGLDHIRALRAQLQEGS